MEVRQGRASWTTDEIMNTSPKNSQHFEVVSVNVWSSMAKPVHAPWPNDEPIPPLILKTATGKLNWDFGRNGSASPGQLLFDDPSYGRPFYASTLSPIVHEHYLAQTSKDGPVIVSIEKATTKLRAMLWSRSGITRFIIPMQTAKIETIEAFFPQLEKVNWTQVEGKVMRSALEAHEARELVSAYKTTENEFYANQELSPAFEHFLSLIGSKVDLATHSGFRGGLQNNGSTGSHSIYNVFKDIEVMFHVAPMLPRKGADAQQLEKKRHLGNDVCVVIFRDEDCTEPFNPECISSQFNHVFIIVQPLLKPTPTPADYRTLYRVAVCAKLGVHTFGPPLPANGVGPHGNHFRDWLLARLINGERAAMAAPDFRGKLNNTRFRYLSPMVAQFTASKQLQAIMSI